MQNCETCEAEFDECATCGAEACPDCDLGDCQDCGALMCHDCAACAECERKEDAK